MRRIAVSGVAIASASILLAGCAAAPEGATGNSAGASKFLPCMVSDAGGFDDKSFNQLGYEGLVEAAKALGVSEKHVESADETVYASNITNLVDQGCNLIVTVGFNLADATKAAAAANPNVDFAIIDDSSIKAANVKSITFNTSQAAFLAGYAAASYSKSGTVGTYGGQQFPTVTIFMDGFADGVAYFNKQKSKSVKVIGWNVQSQTGSFTGGFSAGVESKSAAQTLIDQGADVILPVGGPIFQSAIQAINDAKKDIAMIGVDGDLFESATGGNALFMTSILKGIKVSTSDVVKAAGEKKFTSDPYVGTLENAGVGIAPFHGYASKVDAGLKSELDKIKKDIIAGSIKVESPSAPK